MGRGSENPVFLSKGVAGRAHIFRSYWSSAETFLTHGQKLALAQDSLRAGWSFASARRNQPKGKGAPFFPDAIKTYNNGVGWVVETYPFNALDYLLAVEGALALRGTVSRTLAASSRRFAAFPFIFDSVEDMVDDGNNVKGTAASVWLPLWDRATTYAELSSFICDAQARLPGKEARFSSEFARALHGQGVDAGFVGWQEFRFKMKASRVPWICTGRYLSTRVARRPLLLNDALTALDNSGFLDQFEVLYERGKISSRSPHLLRAELNEVIEEAAVSPTPENVLEILVRLYAVCRLLALSKSQRENIGKTGQHVVFFKPFQMQAWEGLLEGFVQSRNLEFQVARALASITGRAKQRNGEFSEAQPMLGSLLPLKCGPNGWYLPTRTEDLSKQAVWSGSDLLHDLARVLARRYLDSADDDFPAIASPRPASLEAVLTFLRGDLDEQCIARWTEALSLIGWHFEASSTKPAPPAEDAVSFPAVPLAYAALRALLEIEGEWQRSDGAGGASSSAATATKPQRRRSRRPISLACQRSPSSVALAVDGALHWLSVWGVPNPYGEEARMEKKRLAGRDIVRAHGFHPEEQTVRRISAAILVPLDWRDRWKIFRQVTLPQTVND